MKRIEIIVQSDKLRAVIDALENEGVGGITVAQTRGRGKGQRPMIETARGTDIHLAEYNSTESVLTVVDDSQVDTVISAIINAAGTGSKRDGKIFVSSVDEAIDIGSKQKGAVAL